MGFLLASAGAWRTGANKFTSIQGYITTQRRGYLKLAMHNKRILGLLSAAAVLQRTERERSLLTGSGLSLSLGEFMYLFVKCTTFSHTAALTNVLLKIPIAAMTTDRYTCKLWVQ